VASGTAQATMPLDSSSAAERHSKQHVMLDATHVSGPNSCLTQAGCHSQSNLSAASSCLQAARWVLCWPAQTITAQQTAASLQALQLPMLLSYNTQQGHVRRQQSPSCTGSRTCMAAAATCIKATLQEAAAPAAAGPPGTPCSRCCGTRCRPSPP
jgi:hypothetical protein